MKPVLTIWLLIILSCNQQKQAAQPAQQATASGIQTAQQPDLAQKKLSLVREYEDYLKSLDKTQPNTIKAAILNYEWLFKNSDTARCDSGYVLFNEFYEEVARHMQNHQSPEDIPAHRKKEVLRQMKQYGFGTETAEGTDMYTADRDSINPKFYSFVSETMRQFMRQQHRETNTGRSSGEGSMAITPEEFAHRYVFWQRFAKQQPDFILKHWVFAYARSYAEELVFGMENTPLQVEGVLTPAYDTIYRILIEQHSREKYTACYTPYYEALKNNDTAFIERFKEKFRSGSTDATYPETE